MIKTLSSIAFTLLICLSGYCQTDTTKSYSYFQKGFQQQKIKKYQEAIACYDSSLNSNSNYNKVYFFRGLAKYHLNDLQGSIADYSECIKKKCSVIQRI